MSEKERIRGLDALRGIAVLLMVFHHAAYDITHIFERVLSFPVSALVFPSTIGFIFIFVSGCAGVFGRGSIKRALFILCCGLTASVITRALGEGFAIRFGVLTCIGTLSLLACVWHEKLKRLPCRLGWAFLALFAASWFFVFFVYEPSMIGGAKFLYPLGLYPKNFFSADYYPLIPWAFAYLCGVCFGNAVAAGRFAFIKKLHFAPLEEIGKRSLLIYIVHQPLLFAVFWLLFAALPKLF